MTQEKLLTKSELIDKVTVLALHPIVVSLSTDVQKMFWSDDGFGLRSIVYSIPSQYIGEGTNRMALIRWVDKYVGKIDLFPILSTLEVWATGLAELRHKHGDYVFDAAVFPISESAVLHVTYQ